jgi:DNA invertase Pin-like site-specific DNA recombinase
LKIHFQIKYEFLIIENQPFNKTAFFPKNRILSFYTGQLPWLQRMQKGDVLIVSELSHLGRNLMQIMKILHDCMEKDVMVYTVKESYELGNNINSKVLAFAFGLSAEIEHNLISQRTKEALARRKAEGQIPGRPKGSKSQMRKLTGKEEDIKSLMNKKTFYSAIGRILGVHRLTVSSFVREKI